MGRLRGPRPLGALKHCWAAEEPEEDRRQQAKLVGQWQHHNLPSFLRLGDRSQAPTQTNSWARLEMEGWKVRAQQVMVMEARLLGQHQHLAAHVQQRSTCTLPWPGSMQQLAVVVGVVEVVAPRRGGAAWARQSSAPCPSLPHNWHACSPCGHTIHTWPLNPIPATTCYHHHHQAPPPPPSE